MDAPVTHDGIMARRTTPAAIYKRLDALSAEIEELKQDVTRMGTPTAGLLGVSEVAQALDVAPSLISAWMTRGKMPEPIARLKATPVWSESQLEPMLKLKSGAHWDS